MASNTGLVSGPAVGAAQILIWSYSCVFLPLMSTELVCFLLWQLSMFFYLFHRHTVCLVGCVHLICCLYTWWEDSGSSSLATLPLGFNCGFLSTSACGSSTGIWLPWRTWVCPREGQVWMWYSCLGPRGFGSTRYSGELAARAAGNIVL